LDLFAIVMTWISICLIFLAYIFDGAISTISVNSVVKIGSTGLTDFDGFGNAISMSQNRFIVTQNFRETPAERNVVIVFEYQRKIKSWSETTQLRAEGRSHKLDGYGNKISLERSIALVGAYAGGTGQMSQAGYAFIFQATGSKWTQVAKLTPPRSTKDDNFGNAVCVYNGSAWIGAPHKQAVYFYREYDSGWSLCAVLTQTSSPNFGSAISSFGNLVVIGATHDSTVSDDAGAAYIFERLYESWDSDSWQETAKLLASDVEALDAFGFAVGMFEDSVIVGAPYDDDYGLSSGSAWVFHKSAGNGQWTQRARLVASDATASDNFGLSVAINSQWAVVSVEPYWTGGTPPGSVYFFSVHTGEQLLDGLESIADGSARYVSMDENMVLVGGPAGDDFGHASGVVYVLDMQTDPSAAPTAPSRLPTTMPSSPSGQPSAEPSLVPSAEPSGSPTGQPSLTPSAPSSPPSSRPTGEPSAQPSQAPSSPSVSPTSLPSDTPSSIPTYTPTRPTTHPTSAPTFLPTRRPTSVPSTSPTAQPACPTGEPTSPPTLFSTKHLQTFDAGASSKSELSVGLTVGLFGIASLLIGAIAGFLVYRSRREADRINIEKGYEMDLVREVVDTAY
jgi:hypothetical protein